MKNYKMKESHSFKKSLGQNFISDPQLISALVSDANITSEDFVIEIGAGAGSLTQELSLRAKEVLSFEIDLSLKEHLGSLVNKYQNLKIVYMDFLDFSDDELQKIVQKQKSVKVVANIPYYITTPIIFKLFNISGIKSISLMIQKEVAERIVALKKSEDYGALSLMCQYFSEPKINRIVKKNCFYPVPKVDSAFISLIVKQNVNKEQSIKFKNLIRSAFKNRRKMMVNNLSVDYNRNKSEIVEILKRVNINENARAEDLNLQDYLNLLEQIS